MQSQLTVYLPHLSLGQRDDQVVCGLTWQIHQPLECAMFQTYYLGLSQAQTLS